MYIITLCSTYDLLTPIWPGMPHFLSNKAGGKFVSSENLSVPSAASHFKDN